MYKETVERHTHDCLKIEKQNEKQNITRIRDAREREMKNGSG